jgi:GT2 family glycosyltransferase
MTAASQMTDLAPHISVIIPTRDRPSDLRQCLDSLLRVHYPSWDVLVVDQSGDDRSRLVVEACQDRHPRLTYRDLLTKGLSRARNAGLETVGGRLVAFLDDDCTVEPNWLESVAAVFSRHPRAAVVFGRVESAPHDPRQACIPVHDVRRESVLTGRLAFGSTWYRDTWSMGAAMYLQRPVWEKVGPFDVHLGAGTPFGAAEDTDFGYRALSHGERIVVTPACVVRHHGARDYRSGAVSALIRKSAYGLGAHHMKLIRCGDPAAVVLIAARILVLLGRVNIGRLVLARGASGSARIALYLRGLVDSFRLPVDPGRHLYGTGAVERSTGSESLTLDSGRNLR